MAYRRGGRARGGAVPVTAPTARAALSADGAWWRELDDEDPITLEPLRELPYPPFQLDSEGVTHFFDGAVLAQYMMSQGRFENPYTREALSLPECERLDAHLRQHDLPASMAPLLRRFRTIVGRCCIESSHTLGIQSPP